MLASIYKKIFPVLILLAALPLSVRAEIVINEIMYDPAGSDGERDWIEIYNSGSNAVTIKGGTSGADSWRIYQESTTGTINNRTLSTAAFEGDMILGAGEYAVVAQDGGAFKVDYPSFAGTILISGAMSLTGNTLQQKVGLRLGSSGIPWSVVSYSSDQGGSNDGSSLQLQSGGTWLSAAPTPGILNSSTPFTSDSTEISTYTATSTATTTSNNTSNNSTSNSSNTTNSSHYSAVSVSQKTETVISLSAGRDRIGSVGSPLEFKADTNLEYTRNAQFTWNFGDGSVGDGEIVTHTYSYPGEYIVLLNATLPDGKAVARTNVKIIEPEIVVSFADSRRMELKNNSKNEVSLYGRAVLAGGKAFLFPQDTIIKAGQSISFPSSVTGLSPNDQSGVQLITLGETEQPQISAKIEEAKAEKIVYLQNQITVLQQNLAALPPSRNEGVAVVTPHSQTEEDTQTEAVIAPLPQPALVRDAVTELEEVKGIKGWLGAIKKFFLRTK